MSLVRLAAFPLLESGLFAWACLLVESRPGGSAACLAASALILTFTVHVSVHEALHTTDRRPLPRVLDFLLTAVAGVPFDAYRLHHHNHHRFENGLEDFSRTWRPAPDGPVPYGLLRYSLGWPVIALLAGRKLRSQPLSGPDLEAFRRIRPQKLLLVALALGLGACSWKWAALYGALVYLGWVFVSVHNYGQHPPEVRADIPSFNSSWYNRLFLNNGLHFEHHAEPGKAWHELRPDPRAARIGQSHLTRPLFRRPRKAS